MAAYRIAQEALTNVARHAAGSTATVRISYFDQALRVEIEDDGPVAASAQSARLPHADASTNVGTGTGIIGMTERAQALGGSLKAGPRPAGGYQVRATLPLAASLEGARR